MIRNSNMNSKKIDHNPNGEESVGSPQRPQKHGLVGWAVDNRTDGYYISLKDG